MQVETLIKKNVDEVKFANYQNLVFAQHMIQNAPLAARQLLGIGEKEASFIENLTSSQIDKLSQTDLLLFSFRFKEPSISSLQDFIAGDELALTHLHLTTFAEE